MASESEDRSSQARSSGIVSLAIMCSRMLGLVREIVLAALFAGENRKWLDCFTMAFRTPNMLRDLFAEGALSTAFVTTFSKKIKEEGDEPAWSLAQKMATLTACFMSVVVLLGVLLAPYIIALLANGWHQNPEKFEKYEFTVLLAQIMYPFIGIVSLSALVMGMLNAKSRFGIPALASSFFNLGSIIGGGILGYLFDPSFGQKALIGFAIGTLIGGLCQLFFQVPALFKVGYRPKLDFRWKDSGVRKILQLMWPAVIAGSAVQVNVLLNSVFASYIEQDGSVAWLGMAFRLMQLPLGVFGVAVATVTLPAVSRAATEGITDEFRAILARGLRLVFLLTVPSAIGLAILAEPIVSLIFQRGTFDDFDTRMTAAALRFYAVGLLFYAGIKVVQPAFYAIDRRMVPMIVSCGSIVANAAINYVFVFVLNKGHEYLALSTGVIAILNFSLLYFFMRKYALRLETGRLVTTVWKLVVSGAILAAICLVADRTYLTDFGDNNVLMKLGTLLPTIGIAAAAFFGSTHLLKVAEAGDFVNILKRRLRRG